MQLTSSRALKVRTLALQCLGAVAIIKQRLEWFFLNSLCIKGIETRTWCQNSGTRMLLSFDGVYPKWHLIARRMRRGGRILHLRNPETGSSLEKMPLGSRTSLGPKSRINFPNKNLHPWKGAPAGAWSWSWPQRFNQEVNLESSFTILPSFKMKRFADSKCSSTRNVLTSINDRCRSITGHMLKSDKLEEDQKSHMAWTKSQRSPKYEEG